MGTRSDTSEAATKLAAAQAARLRRLRQLITAWQVEAADAAGVSKDSWSRMELGQARIDAVALGRFAMHYGVPAEYVITGRLHGLPDGLLRRVTLAEETELRDAPAGSADSAAHTAPTPGRSSRQRSTRRRPAMA